MQSSRCSGHSDAPPAVPFCGRKRQKKSTHVGRALRLLSGIGPYLNKQIIDWLRHPPEPVERVPEIRHNFLTLAEAMTLRSTYPERFSEIRGDLQMHTLWSDGSGSVQDMAEAAVSRGYSYIAITDHSKGLKIAGGIDEDQLAKQGEEIARGQRHHTRECWKVLRPPFCRIEPVADWRRRHGAIRIRQA